MDSHAHPEATSLASTSPPLVRAHMHIPSISFRRQFPVEVQERIIDQFRIRDDVRSLRACALTCQAWHVRSRFHLFRDIRIRGRQQFEDICSYLRTHKFLGSLVQSILIDATRLRDKGYRFPASRFVCVPLLDQLPNLHRCKLRDVHSKEHPAVFHPSILTYLMTHSSIETLCLSHTRFSSPTSLFALISALPRLRHLVCKGVDMDRMMMGGSDAQAVKLGQVYRRKHTRLRSLELRRYISLSDPFLLIAGGTVENLVLYVAPSSANDIVPSSPRIEETRAALAGVRSLELHVTSYYGRNTPTKPSEIARDFTNRLLHSMGLRIVYSTSCRIPPILHCSNPFNRPYLASPQPL
ncbi:hypothetical protein L226DRAFT_255588 [Lentinus tigrinus ALCF2SS1-7]|uniref:uncharacterized protein n=1 Tax=Lentinus tigrinus ALCF2SS1-7 TaxID=1328758 RepID=UPI0011660D4F|nr:hypothetical protein L226DRAFT_255588 [Lentinus tigrinus ALCF2SS1-7]